MSVDRLQYRSIQTHERKYPRHARVGRVSP